MPDDLFEGATIHKAPTKDWLTLWDKNLGRYRLPSLSKREARQLAQNLTKLLETMDRESDLIAALIASWFDRMDSWPRETGFSVSAFYRWVPGMLIKMDAQEQEACRQARLKAVAEQRHRAVTEFPDAVAPEQAMARIAEIRREMGT